MSTQLALTNRHNHITQKVWIVSQRTLSLSVNDDEKPAEIFLRVKSADCSSELIGLYDVVARLMSLALQYGAPLEKVGDLLAGAKFAPCGLISGHDRLKQLFESAGSDRSASVALVLRTWRGRHTMISHR